MREVIDVFIAARGWRVLGEFVHTFDADKKEVDVLACTSENIKRILALICIDGVKISSAHVKEILLILESQKTKHCLIFYDTITPVASATMKDMHGIKFELISQDYVRINPLEHELVPKHELAYKAKSEEAAAFLKKYGPNLPLIRTSDVISLYYGYRPGDIVRVTRSDSIVYRLCK